MAQQICTWRYTVSHGCSVGRYLTSISHGQPVLIRNVNPALDVSGSVDFNKRETLDQSKILTSDFRVGP